MHLVITERQLKELLRLTSENQELKEAGEEGTPETGTSSDGEKKTGASKWESGVTRGPANQVGVTKWADVVGSSLKRGKANPLNEQETNSFVQILRPDGKVMNAPVNTQIIGLFDQSAMDGSKFKDSLKTLISKENGGLGNKQTEMWIPKDWSNIIKIDSVSTFKTPDNKTYKASFRHPKLEQFRNVSSTEFQQKFYAMYPEPNGWKFSGYYTDQGSGFVGVEVEESFWEKWKYELMAGASILAAVLIPGIGGILVSIGIDLVSAALQYSEGDTIGAGVSLILAFIPVIGRYSKYLNVPKETAAKLAKQFAPITSKAKLIAEVEKLPNTERVFMQHLLNENPDKLRKLIENEIVGKVTQESSIDVVKRLNVLIKKGQIDKVKAKKLVDNLGLKRFGFDFGGSVIVAVSGGFLKYYLQKAQQIEALNIPIDQKQIEIGNLLDDIYQTSPDDYDNKIAPVLDKYSSYNTGTEQEQEKLTRIQLAVIKAYSNNPNQDLNKVAEEANK